MRSHKKSGAMKIMSKEWEAVQRLVRGGVPITAAIDAVEECYGPIPEAEQAKERMNKNNE